MKLRRIALAVAVIVVWAAAMGVPALAQTKDKSAGAFTSGVEIDFNSRYIWRSLAWSQGAVGQPSVWVGRSGLVFSLWSNFPFGDEPNKGQFNEVDFRLSYTKEWENFTLAPAFNIYSYPNQDKEENPTTGELELMVAYALPPFTLSMTHFLDLWDNRGGYIGEIALEFEEAAADRLTVSATARLAFANAKFNAYYIPLDKAALNSVVFEFGLTYNLREGVYLRPHFEWTILLDGEVKSAVAESAWVFSGKSTLVNFGIAICLMK
jgi:hypothetical protein